MKKFICLAIIAILLASCEGNISSVYNYSNAVVVDKLPLKRDVYLLRVRVKADGTYSIFTLRVPRGEYAQFEIGDTIK